MKHAFKRPLVSPTLRHLRLTPSGHSPLAVEIHSDFGLFARSDTLPNSVSHPIPTPHAALCILQHVFTFKDIQIVLLATEILNPTVMSTKKFNLQGPEKKLKGGNAQITWEILNQPRFRITFDIIAPNKASAGRAEDSAKKKIKRGDHCIPFMGVSDFLIRFSLPTEDKPVPENHLIQWMAQDPAKGLFLPEFEVTNGLAIYPQKAFKV